MAINNEYNPPDASWRQRESEASVENPPRYPDNNITQTKSGHLFELDDTRDRERIRIHHRSKTFIEMHSNGDETHKIVGDGYEIIAKNKYVNIKGLCNITIEGDSIVHIKGNKTELIDGDCTQVVKGSYTQVVSKQNSVYSLGNMTIGCGSGIAGGSLRVISAGDINVEAKLSVNDCITATNITSKSWVTAEAGMNAGVYGFVSVLGGLSVGIPVAIPGCVSAAINVSAPLGQFGTMDAILMTDIVNTSIFDMHAHMAKGMGPPYISMV
jgi:hypothetical protein